ncbi:hypothetical protein FO519_009570 [Halicephalobus sp. NKZ332]|nr:hypothetical protein FO519_009570 [Halicephalobus sp. NKZ332]
MLFFLFFFLFVNSATGICPTGTVFDLYSKKSKCLALVTPGKYYLTANSFCDSQYNGTLTSVENAFENFFIAATADSFFVNETSQRYWIGANSIGGTGWTNIDGSNTTYFDWASGEPGNSTGCVSVDMKGLWYNDDCFNIYPYVCEVPEGDISTPQPTIPPQSTVSKIDTSTTTPFRGTITNQPNEDTTALEMTTSTYNPLSSCWSYIPFAIDMTMDLTPDEAAIGLYNSGVFDYKDEIPINAIVFAGNVSNFDIYATKSIFNSIIAGGNTINIVFVNPDYDVTSFQNLTNFLIILAHSQKQTLKFKWHFLGMKLVK